MNFINKNINNIFIKIYIMESSIIIKNYMDNINI